MTYADNYNIRTTSVKFNDVADALDGLITRNYAGVTSGTSTTYTATPTPAWDAYTTSGLVVIIPHVSNSGAATINISGLGAKDLRIGGAAIAAGVLQTGIPTIMAYTGTYFEVLLQNVSIPVGQVSAFAGSSAPTGWLLCDAAAYNTYTYRALHAVISNIYGGTAYTPGVTDQPAAVTTFNVPDLLRRAPVGKGASDTLGSSDGVAYASRSMSHNHTIDHTHTIPNHQHTVPSHQHDIGTHTHTVDSHGHTVNAHGHTLSDTGYALMYLQNATPGVWAARRLVTGVNTWTATAGGTTSTIGSDSGTYSRAIALGGSTDLASPGTSSASPGTGGPQTSSVTGGVTAFLTNAGEGGVTTNSQSTSTSGANTQQHLFVNYIIKF